MDIAKEVKNRLTMQEVAEAYGFKVKRSGFIQCPFHSGDRTASLKLYPGSGGFHCFGCGAHGSVIDFVMKLFHLNFQQALLRLNSDFRLGLGGERKSLADHMKYMEDFRENRRREEAAHQNFLYMVEEFRYWNEVVETFPPIRDGDNVHYHPMYVEAVKRLPYIEYWLDDYMEKGGKEHWETCPITPAMII